MTLTSSLAGLVKRKVLLRGFSDTRGIVNFARSSGGGGSQGAISSSYTTTIVLAQQQDTDGLSPLELAATLYLREGVKQTGSTFARWEDITSTGNHFTQSNLTRAPNLDGNTSAVFTYANSDFMECVNPLGSQIDTDGYMFYVGFVLDSNAQAKPEDYTSPALIEDTNGGSVGIQVTYTGGQNKVFANHLQETPLVSKYTPSIAISLGTFYCARMRYDGSNVYMRVNGSEQSIAAGNLYDNNFATTQKLYIGQGYSDTLPCTIRFVIAFDAHLSLNDRNDLDTWIQSQWPGITL